MKFPVNSRGFTYWYFISTPSFSGIHMIHDCTSLEILYFSRHLPEEFNEINSKELLNKI